MNCIPYKSWWLYIALAFTSFLGLQSCVSSNSQHEYYKDYSIESDEDDPLKPMSREGTNLLSEIVGSLASKNSQTESQIASTYFIQQSNVAANLQAKTNLAKVELNEESAKPKERILAYSATVKMYASVSFDTILNAISKMAIRKSGYVLNSDAQSITIAVPSAALDSTIQNLGSLGEIHFKNIRGVDQTDNYFDLQTRISNAEKTLQRFLELLEKANTVESTVAVEKEIERVSSIIENYKSRLANMHESIAYSTISITLSEKTTPGPIGYVFVGLYKAVKWLFVW